MRILVVENTRINARFRGVYVLKNIAFRVSCNIKRAAPTLSEQEDGIKKQKSQRPDFLWHIDRTKPFQKIALRSKAWLSLVGNAHKRSVLI